MNVLDALMKPHLSSLTFNDMYVHICIYGDFQRSSSSTSPKFVLGHPAHGSYIHSTTPLHCPLGSPSINLDQAAKFSVNTFNHGIT